MTKYYDIHIGDNISIEEIISEINSKKKIFNQPKINISYSDVVKEDEELYFERVNAIIKALSQDNKKIAFAFNVFNRKTFRNSNLYKTIQSLPIGNITISNGEDTLPFLDYLNDDEKY